MKALHFILCTCLLLSIAYAVADEPLQPKHIAQLRGVSGTQISPDGSLIAYNLSVPRNPLTEDDGSARSHLYVVDQDGQARRFIGDKVSVGAPHWSVDGQAIFYLAKRQGDTHTCLYRIPIDGGESERVLEHSTSISSFDIHPDGNRVVFLAKEKQDEESNQWSEKGFDQEIFEEDWQYTRIFVADLTSSELARPLEVAESASQATWSPEGNRLAVALAPTPSVDDSYMAKSIAVIDAESGEKLARIDHASKLGRIRWSPNGERLAFIAGANINDPKDGRLMISSVQDNAKPMDLMPKYEAHVTSFQWQDDNSILWTAGEGTLTRVGSVDLNGSVQTLIEPDPQRGIFSGVSLSADGKHAAVTAHHRTHYTEVFALDCEDGSTQRLTDSNPWLSDIRFAKQETIQWKAKDGLQLQGILIYPTDYQAGQRYPMIMSVHGGPEAHESDGWLSAYSKPGHMAAARGMFVFYPNYRGSTGRGVEFSKQGQADAAGKEFSDLVDAIDHLVAEGKVDGDRVGITGGSYGGYASAWAATFYSDRFAASVMFVGISDNVSKVGTTDIPEEMFLVHHRKRLWDDWEYFLNSSPIRYVERNRTPTLILHGKEDPRVHPSQSLELHRHLKTLGQAPVRLVLYEGEGHGNRKASARLDYNLRQLRWMEHFLKSDATASPPYPLDYEAALGVVEEATP